VRVKILYEAVNPTYKCCSFYGVLNMQIMIWMVFLLVGFSTGVLADVEVSKPFARATNGKNGAVFLTLMNHSTSSEKLIAARVAPEIAQRCELHTHIQEGNTYRMREVKTIDVPAQSDVEMKPGGLHVMVMGLKKPFVKGDIFDLSLTFDSGNTTQIKVPIKSAGAMRASCGCDK